MRLTGSRTYYRPSPPKMPPGLVELMEGLTKEVLKHNPSDIYGFCAGHMQQLLDKRDGPSNEKALSLEEKFARAQAKVRRRAEKRRQEYDENLAVQQQNNNVNVIKTDMIVEVPKDSSIVNDKENENKVAQNIVNTPIHQDQILKDSGEMEISQNSRSTVSQPKEDVVDNKQNLVNLQEAETVNPQICEQLQSAIETESNHQNVSTIVTNTSSNTKPDYEIVNKDLIKNNIDETSKFLNATTNKINKNQDNNLTKNEKHSDIYLQKVESAEHESERSLNDRVVDNDKVENITDLVDPTEAVDKPKETKANVLESFKDEQVNVENSNDNEKDNINDVQQPPPETLTVLVNVTDSISPHHTDDDVKQDQHAEDVQLSTPIDDVQQSNNVLRSNHHDDIQVDNIENPLVEKNAEISQELIEKHSRGKYNVKELNNIENGDQVLDQFKQIENFETNDTVEKMNNLGMNFPEKGVDRDIQTLVTENSGKDTDEMSDVLLGSGVLQFKTVTSLENVNEIEDNKKNSNLEQISTVSVCDHTEYCDEDALEFTEKVTDESQTDDTNQDKTSKKIDENNQNENQGTNMDLETAAITIQKVFRNFLFKSRGSTFEDTPNDEGNFMDEDSKNKEECNFAITNSLSTERRPHGITRMDTVLQTVNEEKSLSLSTDDSSTLSSAATTIQAHVRGFLVRNKLNSNKTISSASVAASNSNDPSYTSIENVSDQSKNKNVLNIHIVPEGQDYLSRDESLITSMELSLDSPPSSINLHPLGYDKSERRKLKREDAIQSISPPSNNSGKLSEDLDSIKELPASGQGITSHVLNDISKENNKNIPMENASTANDLETNETIVNSEDKTLHPETILTQREMNLTKLNSDENDVVTPFVSTEDLTNSKLTHSGEFHDAVLPTRVSRSDTSVVSGE